MLGNYPGFRRRKAHRRLGYLYHVCACVVPGVRERPELGTGLALAWPEACCLGDSKFWQIKIFAHGDGKIAAAAWKETSELRYHLKAFNEFWKQPFLQTKPLRASLGVSLHLTGLEDVHNTIDLFIADVVAG